MDATVYDYGIIIGRFQPFHNEHKRLIEYALEHCEQIIIILGSAKGARTMKNPWDAKERSWMILNSFSLEVQSKIHIIPIRDYFYNDNQWIVEVQGRVAELTEDDDDIALCGYSKDASTYYLDLFPSWYSLRFDKVADLDATSIRAAYFEDEPWEQYVPSSVANLMRDSQKKPEYGKLQEEFRYVKQYKELWSQAPYPVTFTTTDAVVTRSGHILTVRRKSQPGKGCLALPGGFIKETETVVDSMIRELKEETRIKIHSKELKAAIAGYKLFDHPDRSLRGRTISHVYHIDLGNGTLPQVRGGDDADKAMWIPIYDAIASSEEWFEDHIHMVMHFISKGSQI